VSHKRFDGPSRKPCRWRAGLGFLAAAAFLVTAAEARAGLVLQVLDSTASPSGTGSFNVDLTNTSTDASAAINFFSVDLKLSTSDIQFTGADTSTASPYLFSLTGSQGLIITNPSAFPGSEVAANDIAANDIYNLPQGQVLQPGATFGLLHVTYSVDSSAGGSYGVSLAGIGVDTSLVDIASQTVDFTAANGTITIQGPMAVPEPSTLTMFAIATALSLLACRARRNRV
jgi:hypothetical protein